MHVTRNRPDLLWAVQNFNFYNLNNSGMTGESLMGNLTDSQMLGSLGMADEHLENLHGMFRSKAMAPIHRPHGEGRSTPTQHPHTQRLRRRRLNPSVTVSSLHLVHSVHAFILPAPLRVIKRRLHSSPLSSPLYLHHRCLTDRIDLRVYIPQSTSTRRCASLESSADSEGEYIGRYWETRGPCRTTTTRCWPTWERTMTRSFDPSTPRI